MRKLGKKRKSWDDIVGGMSDSEFLEMRRGLKVRAGVRLALGWLAFVGCVIGFLLGVR